MFLLPVSFLPLPCTLCIPFFLLFSSLLITLPSSLSLLTVRRGYWTSEPLTTKKRIKTFNWKNNGGTERDEGNKQKEQWSTIEERSTKDFHLLLQNQTYCWNLTFFLYSFIMKPASLLDGGAAIDGPNGRFTTAVYICIYLQQSVNIDPYADD